MSELSEISFDSMSIDQIYIILNNVCMKNLNSVAINGEECDFKDENCLDTLVKMVNGDALFFNMDKLSYFKTDILYCSGQILKYNHKYDLILIFDIDDVQCDPVIAVDKIWDFSRSLSIKYKIETFYAGLEPAHDMNTRYFSGFNAGPMKEKYEKWAKSEKKCESGNV